MHDNPEIRCTECDWEGFYDQLHWNDGMDECYCPDCGSFTEFAKTDYDEE